MSSVFKRIIADPDPCASSAYDFVLVVYYMGIYFHGPTTKATGSVRVYSKCYTVRSEVSVLANGITLAMN